MLTRGLRGGLRRSSILVVSALAVAAISPVVHANAAATTGHLIVQNVDPNNAGAMLDVGAGNADGVTLVQSGNGTTSGVGVDLTFTRGTSTYTAKVHPAAGSTLTEGDTYTAYANTNGVVANLAIAAPGYSFFTSCATMTVHIDGIQRDAGVITGLAASFKSDCSTTSYTWGSVQAGMSVPAGFTQIPLGAGNLGNAPVGVDTTKTITVSSIGSGPVHLGTPVRTGDAPELTVSDDTCAGATLAASSSCTLVVHYAPTAVGSAAATFKYPADDFAGELVLFVRASGKLLPIAPTAKAYAAADGVGVVLEPATQGADNAAVTGWKVTDVTGTPSVVATLPVATRTWSVSGLTEGTSRSYTVEATSAVGDSAPSPTVTAIVLGSHATAGSVTAITQQVGPSSFVRSQPTLEQVTPTSFGFTSTGAALDWMTVSSVKDGARLVPGHYTGAGTPQVVTASTAGCVTDDLLVTDADFAADGTPQVFTATYSTTCTGNNIPVAGEIRWHSTVGYRAATAAPTSLDLGPVGVGVPSTATPLVVSNAGTLPLSFATVAFTGAQADDFHAVTDTCSGHVVAAGATCTVGVSATASAVGAMAATLTLDDDGVGAGQYVSLSANGVDVAAAPSNPTAAAVVKRVLVSWGDPPTGGAPTGYDIYRGPAGGSLGASPVATVGAVHSWTDRDVTAGQSWFYGIRATNPAGTGPTATTDAATVPSEGLAYSVADFSGTLGIAIGSAAFGGPSVPLVQGGGNAYDPAVSPDGTRVAYALESGTSVGIWIVPIDGLTAPVQITGANGYADLNPAWSPDGRTIAFDRQVFSGGEPSVFTVQANASGIPGQVLGGQNAENPSYTPSGRELVVGSTTGTGGVAIIDPFLGTRRTLAGTEGGASPQVSPDGTSIVFAVLDGTATDSCLDVYPRTHLARIAYTGGPVTSLTAVSNWIDDPTWWKGGTKVSADVATLSGGCLDRSVLRTVTSDGSPVDTVAPGYDSVFPAAAADGGIARSATPPAAVSKLTARVTGASTTTLSWTKPAANDLWKYVVVRSPVDWTRGPNNFGEGTIVYQGLATSVKLTGLTAGHRYGVSVFALDTAGSLSPRASVVMIPTGPPKVKLRLSKSSVKKGRTVTFSGSAARCSHDHGSLQRLVNGHWKSVKTVNVSSVAAYKVTWKMTSRTDYRWRVYFPATNAHPATASPSYKVKVS